MLGLVVLLVVVQSCGANYVDKLVRIQELIQEKEDLLGESNYECYENGACAMEYKQGDLVTFRQEPECAAIEGAEGCSRAAMVRKKRDMCGQMSEEMEQLCGGKKRMSSEECMFILEDMEEQGCGDVVIEKRESTCPNDEWHLSKGICYRHYASPKSFGEARKQCEKDNGGLATLERAIAAEERAFFNDVIKSSNTADLIDAELAGLSDHYPEGESWKEYYNYLDNWAWIGVRREGKLGEWRWASHHKTDTNDWNPLKTGQSDWYNKQPSVNGTNPIAADHGNCVAYFQNDNSDPADANKGAWWNAGCSLKLPFLCEQDASG